MDYRETPLPCRVRVEGGEAGGENYVQGSERGGGGVRLSI